MMDRELAEWKKVRKKSIYTVKKKNSWKWFKICEMGQFLKK